MSQSTVSRLQAQADCERATHDLIDQIGVSVHDIQKQVAASRAEIVRTRELLGQLGPSEPVTSSQICVGVRWRLETGDRMTATCSISEEAPGLFRLVVNGGEGDLIVEDFSSARGAARRASQMEADLVRLAWTEQPAI